VGFGVGFQARAGETFRIQEFMEGAKLAYVRVNEMFNARDLQGLARVCTFKAKADLVVDVMREDVWNVKLISEIAKIGEPRVRSTRLFSAGDDMLFQIDVSMITTERQSLYDRITGLPMSDKGESNGFHTFHRCWTFEIEFDGTKNEPFHDGPYVWKFAGPAP
jgi:predicted lipid-binding transport protein (Tim44 family)